MLVAILSLSVPVLGASAQGVNADGARSGEPAPVSEPMAGFARMVAGEWRLGTIHADTWGWGPGRHSIRVHTVGSDGEGKPWRELVIYSWRPDRGKIHLLSFHPDIPGIGRGVAEGTFEFDGENAAASLELHQPRVRRKLASRWTFDGPDRYREVLLEDSGRGLAPLAEWDYARSMERSASPAPVPGPAPTPSRNIRAFVPFLGEWERRGDGEAVLARSSFEWMEYLDVVALRVDGASETDKPEHLLDAYFYHHVGTDELRCLALSAAGVVYEGGVIVPEDRALQLDLIRYEGAASERRLVRFDFEPDGTLRTREWSVDGDDRALVFDVFHHRTPELEMD